MSMNKMSVPLFEQKIMDVLQDDFRRIAEEELEKAVESARKRARERVGQIAATLAMDYEVNTARDRLMISVRFRE